MKKIFFISLLVISPLVWGQKFVAEANVPNVEKGGFYRLVISPEMISLVNPDFSNLRIYDEKNQEVPYVLSEESPVFATSQFVEYPLMEKKTEPGCCTKIIIRNKDRKALNNISLVIKNAETVKKATLLGSDDQQRWYALKERFYLTPIKGIGQTYEVRILDFPLSNYAFFSLVINDSTTAPLNVIKAGYYNTQETTGSYTPISSARLVVIPNAKAKETTLSIAFDGEKLVDKLDFAISGPPLYYRPVSIFIPRTSRDRKNKIFKYKELILSGEFTSTHQASFNFSAVKTRELIVQVENGDNPVLNFKSVRAYQLNRYMVALLAPGHAYHIKLGDDKMQTPNYDLLYFRDSIPANPPTLRHGNVMLIGQRETAQQSTTFFTNNIFIWSAIVAVLLVLAFMSVRMVKETSAKD
jgi:hypothetical protein